MNVYEQLYAEDIHSIQTCENTDFVMQIGKGILLGKYDAVRGDTRIVVTACELKTKTTDDRVSVRIVPFDTVLNHNQTRFFCVHRKWWKMFVKMTPGEQERLLGKSWA